MCVPALEYVSGQSGGNGTFQVRGTVYVSGPRSSIEELYTSFQGRGAVRFRSEEQYMFQGRGAVYVSGQRNSIRFRAEKRYFSGPRNGTFQGAEEQYVSGQRNGTFQCRGAGTVRFRGLVEVRFFGSTR